MRLHNLKMPSQSVSFLQAVRLGLGEQQGLFFPDAWPQLDCERLLSMALVPRSVEILQAIIGDELDRSEIEALVTEAFTFPAPLTAVGTKSPSMTIEPAMAPNFELRNTSRTCAVPMISSRISTPSRPDATCFT